MLNPKGEIVRVMHFLGERRSHFLRLAMNDEEPRFTVTLGYAEGYASGLNEAIMALNQILNQGEAAIPAVGEKK